MTLATYVVVDVSIFQDILSLEFWATLERPPFLLECKLILRRLLVLLNLGALQWRPYSCAVI